MHKNTLLVINTFLNTDHNRVQMSHLYIENPNQLLDKPVVEHRRAKSSGHDSAIHLHRQDQGHSFEDSIIKVLAREDI